MRRARWLVLVAFGAAAAAACFPSIDALVGDGPADSGNVDSNDGGVEGSPDGAATDAEAGCTADLTRDSRNCGACGRSCLGGECLASTCQPVALASDLDPPEDPGQSSLVVDDDHAWLLAGYALTQVDLVDGALPKRLGKDARIIDADRDWLYYITYDNGTPLNSGAVMRVAKADPFAAGVMLAPRSTLANSLGVGGDLVAFGTFAAIRTVRKDGGSSAIAIEAGTNQYGHVVATSGRVFYYHSVTGGQVDEIGGGKFSDVDDVTNESRLRADDSAVVWAVADAGEVQLRPTTGGGAVDIMKDAGRDITAVALGDTMVLATTRDPSLVLSAPRSGAGPVRVVATSSEALVDVAASKRVIAWTSRAAGRQKLWVVVR